MADERNITLKHKRQLAVSRFVDSPVKQQNRALTLQARKKAIRADVENLAARLIHSGYSGMAKIIRAECKLDPLSKPLAGEIRAARLLLEKQKDSALFVLSVVTGADHFAEDAPDKPIPHKHAPDTGAIDYTGDRPVEITKEFDKLLLSNIGRSLK